jgi:hypothetical protein
MLFIHHVGMLRPSSRTRCPSSHTAATRLPALLILVGFLLLCGVLAYLWNDLAQIKSAHREVMEENVRLRKRLAENRAGRESVSGPFPESSSSAGVRPAVAEPRQPDAAPSAEALPEANTLTLQQTAVRQTDFGLEASMQFEPANDTPLEVFALVVRLPRDSDARILDLQPAGEAAYTEVAQRVAENGLFAVFHAVPTGLAPLRFNLSVSKPVTATVRGTNGIEPFEFHIQPGGAGIRKL